MRSRQAVDQPRFGSLENASGVPQQELTFASGQLAAPSLRNKALGKPRLRSSRFNLHADR